MSDLFGPPTQAGFLTFLRSVAGIDALVLPDTSSVIAYAYGVATMTVSCDLTAAPPAYTLAVYNLGADRVIVYAPDQPNRTFFQDLRKALGVNVFVPGVVASSGDSGTSASIATPPALQRLTLAHLQNLKTPYGREYLALAQSYGPNVWGLS